MNRDVVRQVRQRALSRCEYCHVPAALYPLPFHVDHIIARQHGGLSILENLAFSCLHCNRHKAGTDPKTGELVRLFHPRTDQWNIHFEWAGALIVSSTAVGRATIRVLSMNDPDFLTMREAPFQERELPFE